MGLGSRSTFRTGMRLSQIYSHTPVIKGVMATARTLEDELATEVITALRDYGVLSSQSEDSRRAITDVERFVDLG